MASFCTHDFLRNKSYQNIENPFLKSLISYIWCDVQLEKNSSSIIYI